MNPFHKTSKWEILVVTCLLLLPMGWLGWKLYRNHRIETRFDAVKVGASRADVISILGKPDKVEPCGQFNESGPPPTNCRVEFLYKNSFAPWKPEYFLIYLDPEDRVIDTAPLSSP